MSFTVTEKKLRAVNSGKGWDAIGNMAFQKMKMQMCITNCQLCGPRTWYAENIHLLEKYHKFLSQETKRCTVTRRLILKNVSKVSHTSLNSL